MDEYISREETKEQILAWAACINKPALLGRDDTLAVIDNIPAADVAKVRHGRWEYIENTGIRCTVCGHGALTEGDYMQVKSDYCPNCGAKMDLDLCYSGEDMCG